MSTGKRFLRWGCLIAAALIYIAIGAIPFVNSVNGGTGATGIFKILSIGEMIVLGIMLAILIAVVVLGIKKRAKVNSVIREYESEVKRITWFSWKDTKKSTVVVLIALVVFAAVISLLDLGLARGLLAFMGLF